VDIGSRHNICTIEKSALHTTGVGAPKEKEPLLLYIAATHQVVSIVLVVERSKEGKAHGVQRPVYFLSEVLSPTKQRYPHYQKFAYSIFTTVRKLQQYFAVHPIIVVNEAPLSNILNNPSATGCVSLWGIELLSWEFRDSSHGDGLTEGLDGVRRWVRLRIVLRDTTVYPGSGPSTPEVKPLLPALFHIIFTEITMILELFGLEEEEEDRISLD
jgi:hypothetical protein